MPCKICFSPTKVMKNCQFTVHYTYCPHCEVIALDASFTLAEILEKKQYDQHNNTLENSGYVRMFEDFLDFFWEELPSNSPHTLDFGSGPTPVLAHLMTKRGAHVACYDKFYQPDIHFEGKLYELITSTEVFEHLNTPLETLRTLSKCLKPGGILALMTLFHDNSMENFWKWWYRRDPTHITFYTPHTLGVMAHLCDLEFIKTDTKRVIVFKKR